ncbi:SPOR domain-containing protein [bacterium]|nr:SPOR domain-containing protein [bacterium]
MTDEIKFPKSSKQSFEHNDGLGDLLREREKLEFSWAKTSVVLLGLLAVILIAIYSLFNASKHFFKDTASPESMKTKFETITIQQKPQPTDITPKSTNTPSAKTAIQPRHSQQATAIISKKKTSSSSISKKQNVYTFKVIAGTFSKKKNAKARLKLLKKHGIDGFIRPVSIPTAENSYKLVYRVQAGAFKSKSKADGFSSRLRKKKIDAFVISQ